MALEFVTSQKQGEAFNQRHVQLPTSLLVPQEPDITSQDYISWHLRYYWMINYSVHPDHKGLAQELSVQLEQALRKKNKAAVQRLIVLLWELRIRPIEHQTHRERWEFLLAQKPEDMGGPNKHKIAKLLSQRLRGRVLEAMCGFRTYLPYFADDQVVALDWSREALERYRVPARTRVLFDLNDSNGYSELGALGRFDSIVICFGYKYLQDPAEVFTLFRRMLNKNGRVLLVENSIQAYADLVHRPFSRKRCGSAFQKGGFKKVDIRELPIATDFERRAGGRYYKVEARLE